MTDTPAALRAMRIAQSYLNEIDGNLQHPVIGKAARTTLALASKQLNAAYKADPHAQLDLGDGAFIDITYLRSRVLIQEALTWTSTDATKAIKCAELATQACPTNASAFHILGVMHADKRNMRKARQAMQQAAALDPDNTEILKDLDRFTNTSGREIAAYKATDAGAAVWNVFVPIWNTLWGTLIIVLKIALFPLWLMSKMK